MDKLPTNFDLIYTAAQIDERVNLVGRELSSWADEVWDKSHTEILAIPVLRGAIFFFADLVRKIDRSVEIAPARTWAYDPEDNQATKEVRMNLSEVPAEGRSVLVVDDICDSGRTLAALSAELLKNGAKEVRSAVLIRRKLDSQVFRPEMVGFVYEGDEWLVGYGMDDGDRWRNLPDIHIIRQIS